MAECMKRGYLNEPSKLLMSKEVTGSSAIKLLLARKGPTKTSSLSDLRN